MFEDCSAEETALLIEKITRVGNEFFQRCAAEGLTSPQMRMVIQALELSVDDLIRNGHLLPWTAYTEEKKQ